MDSDLNKDLDSDLDLVSELELRLISNGIDVILRIELGNRIKSMFGLGIKFEFKFVFGIELIIQFGIIF